MTNNFSDARKRWRMVNSMIYQEKGTRRTEQEPEKFKRLRRRKQIKVVTVSSCTKLAKETINCPDGE